MTNTNTQNTPLDMDNVSMSEILKEVVTKQGAIATCFSNFHNYSLQNQMIAYFQMKRRGLEITPINCMSGWNKLGRRIKAGSKAITLLMPISKTYEKKVKDEKTGKEEIKKLHYTKFVYKKNWFCLAQTEGETYHPEKITLPNMDLNRLYDFFGITIIPFDKVNGNIQGYAYPETRRLALNPLCADPAMTVFHEVAHIILNHHELKMTEDLKELEAESVAYIIGSILNFDEKQLAESRGYVQGWFGKKDIPEENAKRIMTTAQKLLSVGTGDYAKRMEKYSKAS